MNTPRSPAGAQAARAARSRLVALARGAGALVRGGAIAHAHSVHVALPRPGQSIEPDGPRTTAHWWPDVPWESAEASPVVSTGMR